MESSIVSPIVSVVIPVYNGGKPFHQCLSSLARATFASYEVIVVADGDTDGSWLVAKEFGANVIRLPHNQGPATARNLGAKAARGNILLFIDADVEIYPDTINKVVAAFEQDEALGALIGSYDDAPGASNFLSQYKNLFHHYTHQNAAEEASTFWGACGAIRRQVFQAVGGFDASWRNRVEDIELGYRLKQAGYKIRLDKTIEVKHLKQWEVISLLKADFFYRALPWTALILRDRQLVNDLNLKLSNRLSVILTYALVASFIAISWWHGAVILACLSACALLLLNAPVYQFFQQKRGVLFALQTVPWHWLYYFYSGLAFALGVINYLLEQAPGKMKATSESLYSPIGPKLGKLQGIPIIQKLTWFTQRI